MRPQNTTSGIVRDQELQDAIFGENLLSELTNAGSTAPLDLQNEFRIRVEQGFGHPITRTPPEGNSKNNVATPVAEKDLFIDATEMRHKMERLLFELAEFGKVVWDRSPENFEKVCVLLKHRHGHVIDTTKKSVTDPNHGRNFFRHQNAIKRAIEKIYAANKDDLHLFIEHFPYRREDEKIEILMNEKTRPSYNSIEDIAYKNATEPVAALLFFYQMQKHMNAGLDMSRNFQGFSGDARFIVEKLENGVSWMGRIHGMCTDKRGTYSHSNMQELIEANIKDYKDVHGVLVSMLNEYSQLTAFQVVVLGGGHFRSGQSNVDQKFLQWETQLEPYKLENYLENASSLAKTRFVVLEPNEYAVS